MNILEITIILLRYNNMGVVSLEIISKLNLNKKENKKAVAKPLALHPFWNIVVAGQAKPPAQQSEQLPSAAIAIAVALASLDD